ncbi:glycerol-3-phosphate dehydrogenase (plasmid) [Persicobacter psychrovividus]|uniref:Glycerol-3-phosphate dehydrogenase n=2 Tax=Persicobacter psychrovividus TaxID=387638 RepID=A0ABM7VL60_9BACT|nr:glycerol-3-phosphate dehydrogenase [Persicobacter psychrovividus]
MRFYFEMDRARQLHEVKQQKDWDIVVIGGGATGLGCALDAATRGFKTLLLEQADFAKGTSSKSTKLIHGGVRYLANGDISLVHEALLERGLLLKNAPHLVKKLSFIIPTYNYFSSGYYLMGMKFYDWLSGTMSLGSSQWLSVNEVLYAQPTLNKKRLNGGIQYFDAQFDDARLATTLVQKIEQYHGVCLNYCQVTGFIKNDQDKVAGLMACDRESQEEFALNAKVVINATGVFSERIHALSSPAKKFEIQSSQGVHFVIDREFLPSDQALLIPKTQDGRVLFAIPWHGKVLVGTTDTPIKSPSIDPTAFDHEVDFILDTLNAFITRKVRRADIRSIFAGLRPLVSTKGKKAATKDVSRRHFIDINEASLVTVTGGKWTTYRKMAEDTLDRVIQHFNLPVQPCVTAQLPLFSGTANDDIPTHLLHYGAAAPELAALEKGNYGRVISASLNLSEGQVYWAVKHEKARKIEDVLARRSRALFLDAQEALRIAGEVGLILQQLLEKDAAWLDQEMSDFFALAKTYLPNRIPPAHIE